VTLVAKSLHRATATDVKTPAVVSDFIHLEQLELLARLGVTETERAAPQRVTISLTLWPRHPLVDLRDEIGNTVNYSKVCDETKAFVRDHSYKLIETLADRLAAHLLKHFSMHKIIVELRKFVLPDTKYVAVTISRTAAIG
jgi:FolB domain-containing protein